MSIKVKLDNANLAILPMLNKNVVSGSGETNGSLMLTGTLEEPLVDGTFNIDNGTLKLKQMSTLIENLKMAVKFEGRILRLEEMSAKIGPNGKLNANGTFALLDGDSNPYQLNVKADNVEIASPLFSGMINGNATVTQQRSRPHIASTIRLDKVLVNMPTIPELQPGESNMCLISKLNSVRKSIFTTNTFMTCGWPEVCILWAVRGILMWMDHCRQPKVPSVI
jgi:translocation and assembly module TamB